jgi:hypothetical protein
MFSLRELGFNPASIVGERKNYIRTGTVNSSQFTQPNYDPQIALRGL